MTTHAYIADLSRERRTVQRTNGAAQDVNAITGVCGVWDRGAELRCFGLRRLAEVWERMGHHVDCPVCRAEVRRLLGERTDSAHEARIAALTEWVEANPLARTQGDLAHEAAMQAQRERRARYREQVAAKVPERVMGVCEFCGAEARAAWDYTCNVMACRSARARATRIKRAKRGVA